MSYGSQDEGTPAAPVCPRHPDRVSHVRCQRCERPACPECQRPAAVGVHCVDCVRQTAAGRRQVTSIAGAPVREGPPVVTLSIIGLTALVFVLQYIPALGVTGALAYAPIVTPSQPWRMLTVSLVHSTSFLLHIGFNMVALWVFGQYLEPILGRWRFLLSYALCSIGGSVMILLLASPNDLQDWITMTVGASGAIFGLFGIALISLRRTGQNPMTLIVMIALNFGVGVFMAGVSWEAHLGGLVAGLLVGAALVYAPRSRRALVQVLGLALVLALLVGLSLWKVLAGAGVAAQLLG